jgi:hypothetical protein
MKRVHSALTHAGGSSTHIRKVILIMKLRSIISIGLIVVVGTYQALAQVRAELNEVILAAQQPVKSRIQVKAEPPEAIRMGDVTAGESSYSSMKSIPICTHPWPCLHVKLAMR